MTCLLIFLIIGSCLINFRALEDCCVDKKNLPTHPFGDSSSLSRVSETIVLAKNVLSFFGLTSSLHLWNAERKRERNQSFSIGCNDSVSRDNLSLLHCGSYNIVGPLLLTCSVVKNALFLSLLNLCSIAKLIN